MQTQKNSIIPDGINISLGSWCQTGHPANAEILAQAGFSWLAADCEHGEFNENDVAVFCRAVKAAGAVPLVRARENATLPIRRALDMGAGGVFVPLVSNAEEAKKAVASALYPPQGVRGFAWQAANQWGQNFDAYLRDFRPVVIVMIETREAVENIDSILAVEGVDSVFIGPYDLSGSYGIPGQTESEIVIKACNEVVEACKRAGKPAGRHIVTPKRDNVQQAIEQNYQVIALGMDTFFLANGARQAKEMIND